MAIGPAAPLESSGGSGRLRVYYHPLFTFSQRVRIALLEKNIPAELVEVDLPGRAQFQPEYLSKNPYGRVPAIERARVAMHMRRFLPRERWNLEPMEKAIEKIEKHLSILEPEIQRKEYLAGDQFTLADICYAPFLQFLPAQEVTPGPAIRSWAGRIVERPSVRETRPAR